MTRKEQKELKIKKELEFIQSIKGLEIDHKLKNKFRTTFVWKDFRKYIKDKFKFDVLTGRKLTKTWNLHHRRTDSKLYTDLDERFFLPFNNQMHDWYHIAYEETRKNPNFLKNVEKLIEEDLKTNNFKSFIYK